MDAKLICTATYPTHFSTQFRNIASFTQNFDSGILSGHKYKHLNSGKVEVIDDFIQRFHVVN
jgi:hypothetical protein